MPRKDAINLWRNSWLNRAARSFNRHMENPIRLRWAGRGSFYAGALHHVGRKSGREYVTPVLPQPIPGGFVIGLPYGADTDWCRNVLAAGKATLALKGAVVRLVHPRVVDAAEGEVLLPAEVARQWRRTGMACCLIASVVTAETEDRAGARGRAPRGPDGPASVVLSCRSVPGVNQEVIAFR